MGLLLSVLVVCVGVLEVIACVRHFQDGYLPLWTPHCAVTSGYAKTHERWREKSSDSYEFRSSYDVSGALNHAHDLSPETFPRPSASVENGYAARHQFQDTQSNKIDEFGDGSCIHDLQENNVSSTLGTEEGNIDLISTYDKELNIAADQYNERKETSTDNSTLISGFDVRSENTIPQNEVHINTLGISYQNEETRHDIPSSELGKHPNIEERGEQGTSFNKTASLDDRAGETSYILDAVNETAPSHILSSPPEDSSNHKPSTDVSNFQIETVSQTPVISESSQETKRITVVSDHKRELEIGDTSLQEVNYKTESEEYIPQSEIAFTCRSHDEINEPIYVNDSLEENEILLPKEIEEIEETALSDREATPEVLEVKPEVPIKDENVQGISVKESQEILASEINENTRQVQYLDGVPKRGVLDNLEVGKPSEVISKEDDADIARIEISPSLHGDVFETKEFPIKSIDKPISLVVEEGEIKTKDTSESRLEDQTTSSEQVPVPKTDFSRRLDSPLTVEITEESHSLTRHAPHQPSVSPPQLPSTPTKKSKADISWPTFFPGAPVIKRPSVSFATPEAVFTNEDQELLRQYAEDTPQITPCIKKTEETRSVGDTSSTEDKSIESLEASERSDSFEEDVAPITFKEKSPSNIVAGNDFSRKELQLQKRKSYKHKRYSSATELNTKEEETEDRSFSENKPNIVRASSLKESRRRFRKPAKASSFEDAMLLETSTTKEERHAGDIPVIEEKEVENQRDRIVSFTGVSKESREGGDQQVESSERIESNVPKSQYEERKEECKSESSVSKEDEEDTSYSLSEEQSSSQQKSPAKEAFWLIFSGEYTKAMSKDWHSGHFCCWQCDESLTGQRYVLRDDHPYCIKCYESVFANVCEECNKTIGIDSKDLSYKDKHWHEACFLCNKCRVSLVDKQFGSKADKIYCGNCYDAQFASRCDGCGEIFRAGTKKMEYKTRQWHEKCFCCCVCKTAIGTKSFIPREQEIYCATCYEEKFATRCVKCNKIITSGGVTYKNEPWHRECFTCTNCNTSLAGQRFTSRDEKPYCADCFGELFAKRCTACSKPITGIGGTRFISFEDRHWHNDCFICASCKTSLVGRGFITDADDIICPECAKQKLM